MTIQREEVPWKRLYNLLPDPELRKALDDELENPRRRRGVKFDQLYAAIHEIKSAAETYTQTHRILTEKRPLMRQRGRVSRIVERLAQVHTDLLDNLLDEPGKDALRTLGSSENPFSTSPSDQLQQKIEDLKSDIETNPVLQARRPEGHQAEAWKRDAHARLKAAGVGSEEMRTHLLRLFGLKALL